MKLSPLLVLSALLAAALPAHAEVSVDQLRLVSESTYGATEGEKGRMNLDQVFEQAGLPAADASVTGEGSTDTPTVPGTYPNSYTSSSYPGSYTNSSYPSSYTNTSYPSSYTSTSYPSSYTSTSYPSSYTNSSYPNSYTSSSYPSSYTGGSPAASAASLEAARYENLPMPQLAR
jgi:hypothetical protein